MSGLDVLAGGTGLSRSTLVELAEKARANAARLNGCRDHVFQPIAPAAPLRTRYRCSRCEGEVDSHAHHWYELGREHASRL